MNYERHDAKQAARDQFHGVWAAITTPFTPDYELDEDGLRQNMDYLTDELHVDGVFCTGVMGEFWALSREEWMRAITAVVEAARGKCRVIAHTGHHSAEETILLTRHAEEVGADFAIIITPYYPPRTEQGVYEWFRRVSDNTNIGIWLFDPPYVGYRMSPDLIAQIAEFENICGMKQAYPLDHHQEVHKRVGDKIVLSQPSERDLVRLVRDFDQQVHMSSPAPYLLQWPDRLTINDYMRRAREGDWSTAEELSARLDPLRGFYENRVRGRFNNDGIMPIAYLKACTEALGMAAGPVRPPLENLSGAERESFIAEFTAVRNQVRDAG